MRPEPYPRGFRLDPRIRVLLDEKALRRLPYQEDRGDLVTTDGVDMVYDLRNMTPSRFIRFISELLIMAEFESNRYPGVEYRYGKFIVELNSGGRVRDRIRRSYTTSMMRDTDDMVYGRSDEEPVELGGTGRSLSHKAEAIINMLDTGSPGAYVNKQNPYRVLRMIVSVRDNGRESGIFNVGASNI